jgi:hypothetical protein
VKEEVELYMNTWKKEVTKRLWKENRKLEEEFCLQMLRKILEVNCHNLLPMRGEDMRRRLSVLKTIY